jgi:hypothetical protein
MFVRSAMLVMLAMLPCCLDASDAGPSPSVTTPLTQAAGAVSAAPAAAAPQVHVAAGGLPTLTVIPRTVFFANTLSQAQLDPAVATMRAPGMNRNFRADRLTINFDIVPPDGWSLRYNGEPRVGQANMESGEALTSWMPAGVQPPFAWYNGSRPWPSVLAQRFNSSVFYAAPKKPALHLAHASLTIPVLLVRQLDLHQVEAALPMNTRTTIPLAPGREVTCTPGPNNGVHIDLRAADAHLIESVVWHGVDGKPVTFQLRQGGRDSYEGVTDAAVASCTVRTFTTVHMVDLTLEVHDLPLVGHEEAALPTYLMVTKCEETAQLDLVAALPAAVAATAAQFAPVPERAAVPPPKPTAAHSNF